MKNENSHVGKPEDDELTKKLDKIIEQTRIKNEAYLKILEGIDRIKSDSIKKIK